MLRSPVLRDLGRRFAVALSGTAAAAVTAPPDPSRPVLVMATATVVACVAAAVLRWRLVGTVAVLVTTSAVLLADALDDDSTVRPLQTLAAAALVVTLVAALGAREEAGAGSVETVVVARAPWRRRLGVPLLALGAGAVVAVTAAQDVVPSVPLVLAGLAAAVTALVVAAGVHRT